MALFVLRRAGSAVLVFLLASVLVFCGIRALPGDPARVLANAPKAARDFFVVPKVVE